jgi:peptidoglycan/LPS O-acetylase OafA/YrhL
MAVLATVLMLCAIQGGIDKLLPPLVWTLCLAAQLQTSSFMAEREPRGLIFAATDLVARALQSPPLVWLGAVSYCIYLVNEPVQKLFGIMLAALVQGDAALFTMLWVPGAVVLPIFASWWLHLRIELPAQHRGRGLANATVSAA